MPAIHAILTAARRLVSAPASPGGASVARVVFLVNVPVGVAAVLLAPPLPADPARSAGSPALRVLMVG